MPLWKIGTSDRDDHLKWERHHWQKYHFWTKSYHVTSVTNNVVNPLNVDMSLLHDKSLWYSQSNLTEKYGFYLNKKLLSTLPLRPGRNHAEVLCNDFMGNLLLLFSTMCNSVKEPCNIKSFNISTACDIWVSRYRPSNLMLATDSALALVFINFLWAV